MNLAEKLQRFRSPSRRERLRAVGHYLTAFVIALDGISKLEQADGYRPFILFSCIAAATIVAVTALHPRLKNHAHLLESVIYLLETVLCTWIGLHALHEGKTALPYAWFIAAILCMVAAAVRLNRSMRLSRTSE